MFVKMNNILKKKKGFTLIELLATIMILSLVVIIIIVILKPVINTVNKKNDDTTMNLIIEAAESYALEYRNENNWNEEIDDFGNISFCVSLNSLIDYGYFTNRENNFDNYRNKYAVKLDIVNGVTSSKIIDLDEVNSGVCRYYIKESNLVNNGSNNVDVITDSEDKIGNFDYDINKINNNQYSLDISLNIINYLVSSIIEHSPINIMFVVDTSNSMIHDDDWNYISEKYDSVKNAVISASEVIIEKNSNSKIGLITFDRNAWLYRDFKSLKISESDFPSTDSGTNISDGINLVTSNLYNKHLNKSFTMEDIENTYVVLLSDGGATTFSVLDLYGDLTTTNDLYYKCGNYDIKNDKEKNCYAHDFFKKFSNTYNRDTFKLSECDYELCTNHNLDYELKNSANYLKNLGAKLIFIGYYFDHDEEIKMIATQDDDLCLNGSGFNAFYKNEKKYCYYDNVEKNTISSFFQAVLKNITEYNTKFDKINLVIEPKLSSSFDALVTFFKDNVEIEGNKIVQTINFADIGNNNEINLESSYLFKLNNVLYDMCSLNNDELNKCSLDTVDLFNSYIEIIYSDGSVANISIDFPNFEVSVLMVDKLN